MTNSTVEIKVKGYPVICHYRLNREGDVGWQACWRKLISCFDPMTGAKIQWPFAVVGFVEWFEREVTDPREDMHGFMCDDGEDFEAVPA